MMERKILRLQQYDYSQNGAYFVTVCTQNRLPLFEDVGADPCVRPYPSAEIAEGWIKRIPGRFDHVFVDAYVVMPDHVHFLLRIDKPSKAGGHTGPPLQQIVQWYKTMTTNSYIRGVREGNLKPFPKRLWQRGYYEHVIRGEEDYLECWKYIEENPLQGREKQRNDL